MITKVKQNHNVHVVSTLRKHESRCANFHSNKSSIVCFYSESLRKTFAGLVLVACAFSNSSLYADDTENEQVLDILNHFTGSESDENLYQFEAGEELESRLLSDLLRLSGQGDGGEEHDQESDSDNENESDEEEHEDWERDEGESEEDGSDEDDRDEEEQDAEAEHEEDEDQDQQEEESEEADNDEDQEEDSADEDEGDEEQDGGDEEDNGDEE